MRNIDASTSVERQNRLGLYLMLSPRGLREPLAFLLSNLNSTSIHSDIKKAAAQAAALTGVNPGARGAQALTHVQTTVDGEVCTGGVTAVFACQPSNDGCDFAGLTQALDWHGRDDFLEHIRTNGVDHVGADVAW